MTTLILFSLPHSQDWKRHKPLCRPGRPHIDSVEPQREATSEDASREGSSNGGDPWDEEHRPQDWKRQRVIRVPAPGRPGEYIEIASSTMTPAMLRDMQRKLEEEYGNKPILP